MTVFKITACAALLTALFPGLLSAPAKGSIPAAPKAGYQPVFKQDFSALSTLAAAPHDIGSGTWIAHTPSNMDWFTFQDPGPNDHPFGLGDGYLTLRVQKDGHDPNNWFAGYSGGLLSSMDGHGNGFAQQYGYFEVSMQVPGTPNTWPAFWLEDAPTLTNKTLPDGAEIDVTESYGNASTGPRQSPPGDPNLNSVTWHDWGHNGNPTSSAGIFIHTPGMTAGFHQYGVDIEPSAITWYYDRKQIWQVPTFSAAGRPMFLLLNLALGGGNHNSADGKSYDWTLTPNLTDLKVKYVAVWASPNSPNYRGRPAVPTGVAAVAGDGKAMLTWAAGGISCNVYRSKTPGGEGKTPVATGVASGSFLDMGLTNGTRYYYRVSAVNASGEGIRAVEVPVKPGAASAASASFIRTDAATQGSWKGVYGAGGASVIGDTAQSLPAYAVVTAPTAQTFTWEPTADTRALQKVSKPAERIASELHADTAETFDINLTDGKPHQVALYFLDYDHKGEVNLVQIKDAVFGNVLDERRFSGFGGGKYGVWSLRRHVKVVVRNAAPTATNSQATVSGLFFGH